jgi:hypothetical protein
MYFADDKDIYDLLLTAKRTLSPDHLLALARKRGIYLSRQLSRDSLIDYLRALTYNWPQLKDLVAATDTPDRRERSTYTDVQGAIDKELLQKSIEHLRKERNETRGESVKVTSSKDGSYALSVEYSEPDYSKTRLFQRTKKNLRVDIEMHADGMRLRHQDNARAQEIVDKLLSTVIESPDKTPISRIDLSGIREPRLRTQFFIHLMTKMETFRLEDVCFMDVATIAPEESNDVADDQGLESDDSDAGDADVDDDVEGKLTQSQVQMIGVVKKAALEGTNLLTSNEYQAFAKSGFFISRSSWFAIEQSGQGRRVEFDARFSDSQNANGFGYRVISVFEPIKGGRFRKLPPSPAKDNSELSRRIEDTARAAAQDIAAEYAKSADAEGPP